MSEKILGCFFFFLIENQNILKQDFFCFFFFLSFCWTTIQPPAIGGRPTYPQSSFLLRGIAQPPWPPSYIASFRRSRASVSSSSLYSTIPLEFPTLKSFDASPKSSIATTKCFERALCQCLNLLGIVTNQVLYRFLPARRGLQPLWPRTAAHNISRPLPFPHNRSYKSQHGRP